MADIIGYFLPAKQLNSLVIIICPSLLSEAVIRPLTKPNYDGDAMLEWRDFCRQIGSFLTFIQKNCISIQPLLH
jgi:hypothetical protein